MTRLALILYLALVAVCIGFALPAHAQTTELGMVEVVQLHERSVPGICVDKAMWAVVTLEAAGVAPKRLNYIVMRGYPNHQDHVVVWLDHRVVLDSLYRGLTEWRDYDPNRVVGLYPATASREQLSHGIG